MENLEPLNQDIFGKFKDFEFHNLANIKGGFATSTEAGSTKETGTDKDSACKNNPDCETSC